MKRRPLDPPPDPIPVEPDGQQLVPADYPVLSLRKAGSLHVEVVLVGSSSDMELKSTRVTSRPLTARPERAR